MTTDTYTYAQELQDILDSHEVQLIQFAKRVKREVVQPFCNKYNVRFMVSDYGLIDFTPVSKLTPGIDPVELNSVKDLLSTNIGDDNLGNYVDDVEPVK